MKSLKTTMLASSLALTAATPVIANESAPTASLVTPGQFTATEMQSLFEQDAKPMQLATLSQTEMKETEGAFVNFAVGAGIGLGTYVATNLYYDRPITWQGSIYSMGTGALTGGVGGALIRASGGGIVGNVAWRPNMLATNFGFAQYRTYRGW